MEEGDYRTTYELEGRNWWFVGMRRICLEWVDRCRERSGGGGRVLDVGCGTGINVEVLSERAPTIGVDLSATALGFCRQRGLSSLVQAKGESLSFPDASFDVVTAFGVIEHIADDGGAVAEWARVLEPGGHVVLLTSAYRWMWSGHDVSNHHVRRYTASEVRQLLASAGFIDIRTSHANSVLFPPIAVVRAAVRLRRRGRAPAAHKDTGEVSAGTNRLLTAVLGAEARWLGRWRLPFGVSIVASGRLPDDGRFR